MAKTSIVSWLTTTKPSETFPGKQNHPIPYDGGPRNRSINNLRLESQEFFNQPFFDRNNHVQRPLLHPRPPQPQRHKCSQFLTFLCCLFPTPTSSATPVPVCCTSSATALSVSSACFAAENAIHLGTAFSPRWRVRWRARRRGRCSGKAIVCLASASAA